MLSVLRKHVVPHTVKTNLRCRILAVKQTKLQENEIGIFICVEVSLLFFSDVLIAVSLPPAPSVVCVPESEVQCCHLSWRRPSPRASQRVQLQQWTLQHWGEGHAVESWRRELSTVSRSLWILEALTTLLPPFRPTVSLYYEIGLC